MAANSAEYQRQYRKTVKPMNERKAKSEGVEEGLQKCIRYLREHIGNRALTGYQAAMMVERAMLETESFNVQARERLIDSMRIP